MAFYTECVDDVARPLLDVLQNLPTVVKIHASDDDDTDDDREYEETGDEHFEDEDFNKNSYGIVDGTEVMLQRIVKAQYARIRFTADSEYLVPIDSEGVHSGEGNPKEYLIPLTCGAMFQYIHGPAWNGNFNTISELLQEPPCYAEVTEDCFVRKTQDLSVSKHVPAHTVVELKRRFTSNQTDKHFLECTFDNTSVAIEIHRNIPTKAVINPKTYTLLELKKMALFPKFINLHSSVSNNIALLDYQLGDELYTKLERPIEVLGIQEVEVLVGWVRNAGYRSYETVIIPCTLFSKIKVREIHVPQMDCTRYLQERYGHCLNSSSIQTALYVLPAALQEITWLRLSDMFIRKGNKSFLVPDEVQLQFEDSAEDSIYATMTEDEQPVPEATKGFMDEDNPHKITNTQKTSMMQRIKGRLLSLRGKDKKETIENKELPVTGIPRAENRYTDMMTLADCFSANVEG